MTLGLMRGTVELYPHETEWESIAKASISELRNIFGTDALDIQHVGSTSIKTVSAKPILDIAVAVSYFEDVAAHLPALENAGYIRRNTENIGEVFLSKGPGNTRTHHIHIVLWDSRQWHDYIFFRDYLNSHPDDAEAYNCLKYELLKEHKNDRAGYTDGKAEFIERILNLRNDRQNDRACEVVPRI